MNEVDERIRAAFDAAGIEFDDERNDSLLGQALSVFQSTSWWLSALIMFWQLVFLVVGVLCAVRFFNVTEPRDHVMYATAFLFCMLAGMMMKLWFWMQMNRNVILREIKGVELQVARAAASEESRP